MISKALILETNWSTFKKHWIIFVECHDDAPITINENKEREAILFYPRGRLVLLKTN